MIQKSKSILSLLLFFAGIFFFNLQGFHSHNKFFLFLENDDLASFEKKHNNNFNVAAMYTTASTAFKRGGNNGGVAELWGDYDLKDVLQSYRNVYSRQLGFKDPVQVVTGSLEFADKSMKFRVDQKVQSMGLSLSYKRWFFNNSLFIRAWIPVLQVNSYSRYQFKRKNFLDQMRRAMSYDELKQLDNTVDSIRRLTHTKVGFNRNDWSASGFGDLDFCLGYKFYLDHEALMRSINIIPKVGFIVPCGLLRKDGVPSSLSVMGNNHFAMYGEVHSIFELKQNLKVGLLSSGLVQTPKKHNQRIANFREPSIYSSLKGQTKIQPGFTFQFAPYLQLEHLADGLHLQFKYTYLRHSADTINDMRRDKSIPSFLSLKPSNQISQHDISQNIAYKRNLTKWRSHYITFQVSYDSSQALSNWNIDPNFYLSYDWPIGGNGAAKTHALSFGAIMQF